MSRHHDCPNCTCGQIQIEYSGRGPYGVDPNNLDEVVESIILCSLDHRYDRTKTGIPYGFPSEFHKVAPVISDWFRTNHPEWFEKTAYLTEDERQSFKDVLLKALSPVTENYNHEK